MPKHKPVHHLKTKKPSNVKWMWIAGGLIVVLALSFWIFSSSPKSSETNQTVQPTQSVPKDLAKDCSVLNTPDVQSVFSGAEIVQQKDLVEESLCSKGWQTFKVDATSRTPGNAIALVISNTSDLANYNNQNPSFTLDRVCAKYPSINLGDYKSCNLFGEIYFGKGNYLIQLQCVGCPDGNGLKLANTLASRL